MSESKAPSTTTKPEVPCNICLMANSYDVSALEKQGGTLATAFESGVLMGWISSALADEQDMRELADESMCEKHAMLAAAIRGIVEVAMRRAVRTEAAK